MNSTVVDALQRELNRLRTKRNQLLDKFYLNENKKMKLETFVSRRDKLTQQITELEDAIARSSK